MGRSSNGDGGAASISFCTQGLLLCKRCLTYLPVETFPYLHLMWTEMVAEFFTARSAKILAYVCLGVDLEETVG
jgi:hypothetical protein